MTAVNSLNLLAARLQGDLLTDEINRIAYATDASSYREKPLAVVIPRHKNDIKEVITFARQHQTSIIPRAAGTSLAGQVVGAGIVVDVSKHLDKILELNVADKWVKVEPGVNLSELNLYLKPHGLQFSPETSTANRCRLGGMLGNNSCGLHSLIYGSVREHIIEVEAFLADGSEVVFKPLNNDEFNKKCKASPELLETKIYRQLNEILSNQTLCDEIIAAYPSPEVTRRNMGYALDSLINTAPFNNSTTPFNLAKLLAGSEGTLAFTTAMKLNLIPLPPKVKGIITAHFHSLDDALRANIIALKHNPGAIELMDDVLMNCTRENITQRENRFFIKDDPKAILIIEFARDTPEAIIEIHKKMVADFETAGYGYHFPLLFDEDKIQRVWDLRKAGLGLLSNLPGDKRSVTVIEDTAVAPALLPDYVADFKKILDEYQLSCVFYAHIATGELHLRPLLNLKDPIDQKLYRTLAQRVAELVKKYRGSLSGEHGDGRLRGAFIPFMLGDKIYNLFREIKKTWDPWNVLNPNKIVDVPPITTNLRYEPSNRYPEIETTFDFRDTRGFLRAIEKCTGSGDCRKSELVGGTMCPTFMATRDEDKSTRGRANVLRELIHHGEKKNPLDHEAIYEVLDLCLSCKACKSECPSNVDMAKFKAEFLQHYYDVNGAPFRSKMIAWLPRLNALAHTFRTVTNYLLQQDWVKRAMGFDPRRTIPLYQKQSVRQWHQSFLPPKGDKGKVYLFADEFTNHQESDLGIKTILFLSRLGYEVLIPTHRESGRTFLSKGFVRESKRIANDNVKLLSTLISEETPLIGIEPSTILTFRDEYPVLVDRNLQQDAIHLGKHALLLEEFFVREIEKGKIDKAHFTSENAAIKFHGHCQQKAVASTQPTWQMLSFPENYTVSEIKSGCCGMAGSFGYEKEHYELSMQIGEMVLFPEIRKSDAKTILAASGTSCRHHIKDGTGQMVLHPIEVMYDALKR